MSETIWVMDSDLCEMCGELLDDWGICPACGYDGVEWEREEDDDEGLFDAIDDAWQVSDEERKRVHALFLQKLEARYPGHPWVK